MTVGRSLDWQIVPEHFIIVLPAQWNSSRCGQTIHQAEGSSRYLEPDLVVHSEAVRQVPVRPDTPEQASLGN